MIETRMGIVFDRKDVEKIRELTLWGMKPTGEVGTVDDLKDRLAAIRRIVEGR